MYSNFLRDVLPCTGSFGGNYSVADLNSDSRQLGLWNVMENATVVGGKLNAMKLQYWKVCTTHEPGEIGDYHISSLV